MTSWYITPSSLQKLEQIYGINGLKFIDSDKTGKISVLLSTKNNIKFL